VTDEPIKLPEGFAPISRSRVIDHKCEHEGCYAWGGWGFGKPKGEPHWFCFEHRAEGERYL